MSNNQNCTFDNFGFDHICRICNTRQLPKILANFGAVSKAVQPLPKEDEMDKPYGHLVIFTIPITMIGENRNQCYRV